MIFLCFSRATGERHENATCKEPGLKPDFARGVVVEGKAATMHQSRRGADFAREFDDTPPKPTPKPGPYRFHAWAWPVPRLGLAGSTPALLFYPLTANSRAKSAPRLLFYLLAAFLGHRLPERNPALSLLLCMLLTYPSTSTSQAKSGLKRAFCLLPPYPWTSISRAKPGLKHASLTRKVYSQK